MNFGIECVSFFLLSIIKQQRPKCQLLLPWKEEGGERQQRKGKIIMLQGLHSEESYIALLKYSINYRN